MKYKVLQINVRAFSDYLNEHGHAETLKAYPAYSVYLDSSVLGMVTDTQYHEHVANIEARDLEHAFKIGNVGPGYEIEYLASMHSISVGDILAESETGRQFMVAPFGFKEIV